MVYALGSLWNLHLITAINTQRDLQTAYTEGLMNYALKTRTVRFRVKV